MAKCEFPEGCEQEGEPRKMMLDLAQIKDGGIYPWAEHVKATLCDEHHEIVQTDPDGYFPDRVTTTPQMWRALSSWRDESDGEFVIWHVRTASDDGRAQTVHVWVDVRSVAIEESPAGGGELFEVQQAIKTRGMSVIELNQDLEDLPASFVYRRGSGGFVEK